MSTFDWKKNVENSTKIGVIITVTTTGLSFTLKTEGMKPTKAALDAMDMMKFAAGISVKVKMKDYAVYKKIDHRVMEQKCYGFFEL